MRLNKREAEAIARIVKRELISIKDEQVNEKVQAYKQSEEYTRTLDYFTAMLSAIDSYNKLVEDYAQIDSVCTPDYYDRIYITDREKALQEFEKRLILKFKARNVPALPSLTDLEDMVVCQALSGEGSDEIIRALVGKLSRSLVSN